MWQVRWERGLLGNSDEQHPQLPLLEFRNSYSRGVAIPHPSQPAGGQFTFHPTGKRPAPESPMNDSALTWSARLSCAGLVLFFFFLFLWAGIGMFAAAAMASSRISAGSSTAADMCIGDSV